MRFIAKEKWLDNLWYLYDTKTNTFAGYGYSQEQEALDRAKQFNKRYEAALKRRKKQEN